MADTHKLQPKTQTVSAVAYTLQCILQEYAPDAEAYKLVRDMHLGASSSQKDAENMVTALYHGLVHDKWPWNVRR